MSDEIDVSEIINSQKIGRFNITVMFWSFLLVFVDGYDFSAPAFAAPALIKSWHIANMAVLGSVFSVGIVGILFGAPILGYVADRYGRRVSLLIGLFIFGIFSLATTVATSVPEFMVLRFLTGIGIGGVMPVTIALNTEYAPKRLRAKLVCIMFSGVSVGVAVPGLVSAYLMRDYGWEIIFVIGGIAPLVLVAILPFVLPESLKFLALRHKSRDELLRVLKRMRPGLSFHPDARFIVSDEPGTSRTSVKDLFIGSYAVITPILWLLYIATGMATYAVQVWTPTLLTMTGLSVGEAAIATSIFQVGAATGGLVVGWPVDRFGWKALTVMLVLAVPVVACVGIPGKSKIEIMALLLLAGFLVIGTLFGMNAMTAMMYPAANRANGVGWALGIARIGFIIGAMTVGYLAALKASLQILFLCAASPLVIAAVMSFVLNRLRPVGAALADADAPSRRVVDVRSKPQGMTFT